MSSERVALDHLLYGLPLLLNHNVSSVKLELTRV
jgi:hypothetical protein